jgi:hypothetical protein
MKKLKNVKLFEDFDSDGDQESWLEDFVNAKFDLRNDDTGEVGTFWIDHDADKSWVDMYLTPEQLEEQEKLIKNYENYLKTLIGDLNTENYDIEISLNPDCLTVIINNDNF